MEKPLQDNIDIKLPVKIGYTVLENVLRGKMAGEMIQVEKGNGEFTKYAQVLDLSISRSSEENFDLTVEVKFRSLLKLFRNKNGSLLFHLRVHYDEAAQLLEVDDYRIKGNSDNWMMDRSLETVANKLVYNKLKSKMRIDLIPHIEPQVKKLNAKLQNDLEAAEGVFLSGKIENVSIAEIIAGETDLFVLVHIKGDTVVEITQIKV